MAGVVVFESSTIPFAVREPLAGTDLDAGPPGLGVSLSLRVADATALHDHLRRRGVPILIDPFGTSFVFEAFASRQAAVDAFTSGSPQPRWAPWAAN